jgi:hypothetical protein
MENQMTKQQKWMPESPFEACAATYGSLAKALDGLQNKFEMPEAAREFVKRGAAAAKDRSSDLHAGANRVTGAVEDVLVGAVNGLADLNRKIIDATHQDLNAAFAAIDKLPSAESLTDVYETYVDYLRQQGDIGVTRATDAASFVSAKASEGFDRLHNGIAKFVPVRSQAA